MISSPDGRWVGELVTAGNGGRCGLWKGKAASVIVAFGGQE